MGRMFFCTRFPECHERMRISIFSMHTAWPSIFVFFFQFVVYAYLYIINNRVRSCHAKMAFYNGPFLHHTCYYYLSNPAFGKNKNLNYF